jgi:glycosyltransferase involved in cell wall biosynthesis
MVHTTEQHHHAKGISTDVLCMDGVSAIPSLDTGTLKVLPKGPGKFGWAYHKTLLPWLLVHLGRYDAVVVHGLWLYPSHAVARAIRILRKKGSPTPRMLVFPHGMLDPWFQSIFRRPIKSLRNTTYWLLFERHVISTADCILFTSKQEQLLARKTFPLFRTKREAVVPYGSAEPPPFDPQLLNTFYDLCPAIRERPYWLFMSRIHAKKGIDLLIKAYQKLIAGEGSSSVPALIIAGPGLESDHGKSLKMLVPSNDDSIHFCDMLRDEAKWGALYGCSGFFLPSHQENFGIVVAEALACGKRVYLSNQVNIHAEVTEAGVGISEDDTQAGVDKLMQKAYQEYLVDEPETKSESAKNFYQSRLNLKQTAEKLIEIIHECQAQSS